MFDFHLGVISIGFDDFRYDHTYIFIFFSFIDIFYGNHYSETARRSRNRTSLLWSFCSTRMLLRSFCSMMIEDAAAKFLLDNDAAEEFLLDEDAATEFLFDEDSAAEFLLIQKLEIV